MFPKKDFRLQTLHVGEHDIWNVIGAQLHRKNCRTVLYVGIGPGSRFRLDDILHGTGMEVTVLEPWEPYIPQAKENYPWLKEIIHGDIRLFETDKQWDAALWIHGPEHVSRDELTRAMRRLEACARHFTFIACPCGESPQTIEDMGGPDPNPYDTHLSHLQPEDLEKLGYRTIATNHCCKGELIFPGQIIAGKDMEEDDLL